ncbi:transcription initiation protein SPT3 [Nematocida minor]|uniref:transcription initiation protein SPT3 n=1 Tax=Nematocida minor TaxID=1912983 RepID=UPI002220C8B6|nr:transcription initiation protein SPT3 [Nematocida minor]KAI5189163.1 transcription initiation protein SPT3 [Nematocida minor]
MPNSSKTEYSSLVKDSKEKGQNMYSQEIEAMMYTCGDVRMPEKESSAYMEQIIYVQMKILLSKAHEISKTKGSKKISIEDIVFLMRNNPYRVKKLSNYITFKDVRNKVNRDVISLRNTAETKLKYSWLPKNVYERYEEMHGRLYAIDKMTEGMTKEEYLDFTECRQASFTFRKGKRFKEFLNTDYKIKDDLLDILGFLACEIVFDIISMACKISTIKSKKPEIDTDVKGMFKAKTSKHPVTIADIDEACRRLKIKHIIY